MQIAECTMKFGEAQKKLEAEGHEVINPLQVVNDWKCSWDVAMRKCIAAMMECEAVYVLNNYSESRGARLEIEIAGALRMKIRFQ